MNVQKEDLGNCQVQLTVTVEPEQVQEQMRKAARKRAKNVRIPGFRPGKAPYHVLVNYLGERSIREDAVENLLPKALEQAVAETDTEIWNVDDIEPAIDSLDPLVFRFVIPSPPKVVLGDFDGIEVPEEAVNVEDEAVLDVLEELRESRASWIPTLGPAQYGDMITLDLRGDLIDGTTVVDAKGFEGVLTEQPKPEEEEETPTSIIEVPGQEKPKEDRYPDLPARLAGMMVNQVKEFNLVYPQDWPEENIAGRTVLYRATLLDLKKKVLPALDDQLAQSVGEFDDLQTLKERVRTNLLAGAEYEARNRYAMAVLDALADASELEYPPAMLKHQIDHLIEELEEQVKRYDLTLDQYLDQIGQTRAELEDEYRDRAERFLRRSLVLTEYIGARSLEATPEEIEREIDLAVAPYGDRAAPLRERIVSDEESFSEIINRLLTRKAVNKLVAEVSGRPEEPLFPEMEEEEEPKAIRGEDGAESDELSAEVEIDKSLVVEAEPAATSEEQV
ncbi:MAG: trigger factor [Ardenticatenaceae bacterium]|nr:trigger factor [Ardenticatenaceae bacterium]